MRAGREIETLKRKLEAGEMSPSEPLFTLRAQDRLAPEIVRAWIDRAGEAGVAAEKLAEAAALADLMEAWQEENEHKIPD